MSYSLGNVCDYPELGTMVWLSERGCQGDILTAHEREKDGWVTSLDITALKTFIVSPSAQIVCMENIGFVYPAMSMMVIGSFASYTKTKSVESAV